MTDGKVSVQIEQGIARVEFFHPKKNSLPGALLKQMAEEIRKLANNAEAKVIVIASQGQGPFCAGASFDELTAIANEQQGKEFFMGFARVILALRDSPQLTIGCVQGKTVGGGVGVVAATDYALAVEGAAIKLSELALGIGPFVVGPAVARKVGLSAFSALSIDTDWRDANWAWQHGLYAQVFSDQQTLEQEVQKLAQKLASNSPQAMQELKKVFWQGTEDWPELLEKRAEISGRLVLSDFTSQAIAAFKAGGKK